MTFLAKKPCDEDAVEDAFKSLVSEKEYVETKIATKFGEFFFRVYKSSDDKENFVLWKGKFSNDQPPLVRVHSECITGDLLGSLKCDCGEQFQKSMKLIQDQGGILIYLRQEGRGIGLFEKIKAYRLQETGYDTFEANTLLGHNPDERSYEMVKVILDDFNLNRIRLLTNNPSKVSEIVKYDIEVVEQISLYVMPNKYNRKYFDTKRKKFHHIFNNEKTSYFYQFHVDNAPNLNRILQETNLKIKDPFLQIYVGISTSVSILRQKKEHSRIKEVYNAANNSGLVKPILHLSFLNSENPMKDLDYLKKNLPFVSHIQVNDVHEWSYDFLKKAYELYEIDLPLSDENFDILIDPKVGDLIRTSEGFILIDNSKGTGKTEFFEYYKNKIDFLFDNDIRNIGLCGGFGPNQLDTYFAIRKYYYCNFSIDAESNLKKNGKFNVTLTKQYLDQLLQVKIPCSDGILQTKKFLKKQERDEWDLISVEGKEFLIHPKVFHAGNFPSSMWYADKISKIVGTEESFCEVGCGAGLASCLVASRNPDIRVTATDINEFATANTKINAEKFGVASRLETVNGDVLDQVKKTCYFDSIFWAMPFGYLEPGMELSLQEMQVFDPGYRSICKFFRTAKRYLKKHGRLLIGFSENLGHTELLNKSAKESGLKLRKIASVRLKEEKEIEFLLLEGRYI